MRLGFDLWLSWWWFCACVYTVCGKLSFLDLGIYSIHQIGEIFIHHFFQFFLPPLLLLFPQFHTLDVTPWLRRWGGRWQPSPYTRLKHSVGGMELPRFVETRGLGCHSDLGNRGWLGRPLIVREA